MNAQPGEKRHRICFDAACIECLGQGLVFKIETDKTQVLRDFDFGGFEPFAFPNLRCRMIDLEDVHTFGEIGAPIGS